MAFNYYTTVKCIDQTQLSLSVKLVISKVTSYVASYIFIILKMQDQHQLYCISAIHIPGALLFFNLKCFIPIYVSNGTVQY